MICFFLQFLPNLHALSLDYFNYLTILYSYLTIYLLDQFPIFVTKSPHEVAGSNPG